MIRFAVGICSLLFLARSAFAEDGQLRCNGSIVDPGMNMNQVTRLCGEPTATEIHDIMVRQVNKKAGERDTFENKEAWLYDLDPGSYVRVVMFKQGKVEYTKITELRGRGNEMADNKCEKAPGKVAPGVDAVLVKYLCGDPSSVSVISEEFQPVGDEKNKNKTVTRRIRTEQWQYRGKRGSLRVILRDAIVTRVE